VFIQNGLTESLLGIIMIGLMVIACNQP
jgi:hypothetical protein